jgi:hypothetical protein
MLVIFMGKLILKQRAATQNLRFCINDGRFVPELIRLCVFWRADICPMSDSQIYQEASDEKAGIFFGHCGFDVRKRGTCLAGQSARENLLGRQGGQA